MSDPWGKRPGGMVPPGSSSSSSFPSSSTPSNSQPPWVSFPNTNTNNNNNNNNNAVFNQPTFMQPPVSGNMNNDGRITAPFAPPQPQVWNPSASSSGSSTAPFSSVPSSSSSSSTVPFNNAFQPFTNFGGQPGAFPGADVVNNLSRNPLAQVAAQYSRELVENNVARYAPGALSFLQSLRYYFDINQSYVAHKLKKVLFPFVSKTWSRIAINANDPTNPSTNRHPGMVWAPPIYDENAPDLYIPVISFITYILVCGLLKGTQMQFTPEVLVNTSSSGILLSLFEILIIKGIMYALAMDGASLLDLLAFTGYKYVGITINTLIGLAMGSTLYYLALLYTGCCMVYFFVNTLTHVVDGRHSNNNPLNSGTGSSSNVSVTVRAQRRNAVVLAGFLQMVLMWWLGQSSDL